MASYEAPAYRPTACPALPYPYLDCHDFNPGAGVDSSASYTLANNGSLQINFQWAQPWYGVSTDLDLFIIDAATGAVLASSVYDNAQTGLP